MKHAIVAVALLTFADGASSCSLSGSREFPVNRPLKEAQGAGRVLVKSLNFVPSMGGGTSCDGLGFLSIELEGKGVDTARIRKMGYFLRPKSGVVDEKLFPRHAIAPFVSESNSVSVSWDWSRATPTQDGEYRWVLELVPVSKQGVLMPSTEFCASSDNWCSSWAPDR